MTIAIAHALRRIGAMMIAISLICAAATRSGATGDDVAAPISSPSPAPSESPNSIKYADLAHESYTATGPLTASFAFPSDKTVSPSVATRVVVDTVYGAGVELRVNGELVPLTRIGRRTASAKGGTAQFEYFGVVLKPGPNELVATPIGAAGLRGASATALIYGCGPPATLRTQLQGTLVADGRSAVLLDVSATDRWGDPAMAGVPVKVTLMRGDARFASAGLPSATTGASPAPTASPGSENAVFTAQLGLGGHVGIPIVPGLTAGDITLQIAAGELTSAQTLYVAPYLRKPLVNGLVSVGAGAVPIAVDGDGVDDGGSARRARAALFASGRVGKQSLLTVAYESQNTLAPLSSYGPFVDDPNERPYQTYGDSSTRSSDFESNDRLYARLDSGRDSIMWGQFQATAGDDNAVGAYRQLLSGAKVELANKDSHIHVNAFTARNQVAYVSTTIPVSGLLTLAQPLQPDIVVGSDYITLASIDRRTGAVISQTPLIRNVDYTIDYATGTLRFINVPLPFDPYFNPQVLQLQYQYQGIATHSAVTGGNAWVDIGGSAAAKLRVSYVNDATGASNFSLVSQSLTGKLPGGQWILSHASSSGSAPGVTGGQLSSGGGGNAIDLTLNDRIGPNQIDALYQDTAAGFADPFGGISSPGFTNYRVAWSRHAAPGQTLTLEADGQRNHGAGVEDAQNNASLLWNTAVNKTISLLFGVQAHAQQNVPLTISPPLTGSSPEPNVLQRSTQMQAQLGFDWKPSKRVGLNVQRDQDLTGATAQTTQPAQTSAELSYAFDDRSKVFVRQLLSDSAATAFAQSAGALGLTNLGTRSTQIGFERAMSPAMNVESDYLITDTGNATDIYSALGVTQKFSIGKRLSGNLTMQQANASGAGAAGFTVYGGSVAYSDSKDFRAALAYQSRTGSLGGTTFSGGLTGHVGPNIAVLGTLNQVSGSGTNAADDRISLAYRPQNNDTLVSLLGYERLTGTSSLLPERTDVLSFEEVYRPWNTFELAGRVAEKLDGDGYYAAHTSLFGLRARQNVGTRFDVGAELRMLNAANVPGAQTTDVAAEAGYTIGNDARLAAGYNFSGSIDPTLSGKPQRKGFYFTFTTLIDRIFGWGASR